MSAKPADYRARRQWQLDARARGEVPECGREACHEPADPAWLNHHTPLIYCAECAALINRYNPGFCYPESSPVDLQRIEHDTVGPLGEYVIGEYVIGVDFAAGTVASATVIVKRTKGVYPFPGVPEPRVSAPNPDRGRHREKTERRRERKAANAKRTP